MKEFGKIITVSKEFHDSDTEQSLALVNDMLRREFDQYKEKHYPTWDGEYRLLEGGIVRESTLVRIDGEEVSDEVMDKYLDYQFSDGPAFDFGDEYTLKFYELYQFGWYAAVPDELVVNV